MIRWKHKLWGNRTALELADAAQLEKFMAHDAVQDLLDKVRDQIIVHLTERPFGFVMVYDPWLKFGLAVVSHVRIVESRFYAFCSRFWFPFFYLHQKINLLIELTFGVLVYVMDLTLINPKRKS